MLVQVFSAFAVGIFTLMSAIIFGGWIALETEAALSVTFILLLAMWKLWINSRRLYSKFGFDESESINFDDILNMDMNASLTLIIKEKIDRT
eukprot:m.315112 g.315112  ORF g.315112 m.315112 type:complete len:92 (+) comp16496_c1_seq29:616-891(+)